MSNWRDVNRDSWTFSKRSVIGAGGGVGDYLTSYAVNKGAGAILNGRVSADVRLIDKHAAGAGLICRADEYWNYLAFYVSPAIVAANSTVARISAFRYGRLIPVAVLAEAIVLPDDYAQFSLEFYSGAVRGELRCGDRLYQLTASAPHVPFPGYIGVMKMYGAEVVIRSVMIEETEMQFAVEPARELKGFEFNAFLCHAGADKELILDVARQLRDAGVKYWLDSEQIQFGASITQKIEDGLQKSRYVIPCLSERLAQSGWSRAEYGAVLNAEFSGPSPRSVIPLKLDEAMDDATIPFLLRDKKRVVYSNKTEFAQFVRFLLAPE